MRYLQRMSLAFLLLAAALTPRAHAADPRESGPLTLVITYHAAPAQRTALRKSLEESEVPRLRHWKDEGVLKTARLLVNRYADSVTWDAMAILTFGTYADVQRWNRIEQSSAGGLSPATLALVSAIETTPGDLMREGGKGSAHPTYLVVPYEYLVSADEYVGYVDDYVVPQMDGWMEENVLARYGFFLARYPAGRPWQAMLILEYRDDESFGAREATTAKVRARLRGNARWKAISDSKKSVRSERAPVIADEILAR